MFNFELHPRNEFLIEKMKKVETSIAEMHIDEDGILQIKIKKGAHLTLESIKEYYTETNKLLGENKALVLFDASADYTITEEAKKFGQTDEATENRIAIAYITNSITNKLVYNLYVKVYKPKVPMKMFSNKEKGLAWLKSFYVLPGEKYIRKKKK